MAINKGFIRDVQGNTLLPITRGELVLDANGQVALTSSLFLAGENGNAYGLVSAAERALISGNTSGVGGINDIYDKVGYINSGVQVNSSTLNFYKTTSDGTTTSTVATPINFVNGDGIALGVANNTITVALKDVHTGLSASEILKSITVDKYGRVTAVTSGALTNAEIPNLEGKTITNSVLSGCTTDEVGTSDLSIVNKAYVDAQFSKVSGIASGALQFGGAIADSETATNVLANSVYLNHYFKATGEFKLSTGVLEETSGISGTEVTVKVGDTLIVYAKDGVNTKFVYVPSGDDVTTLSVWKEGDTEDAYPLRYALGNVGLKFSAPFSVTNTSSGNIATISMVAADATHNGYLSASDWQKFQSYASQLSTTYTEIVTANTLGSYEIGTLVVGETTYTLYGKNSVSSLSINNGTTDEYNPILKFTETGATDINVTFKGGNGILVRRSDSAVEFIANNTVATDSQSYLTITNGSEFKVNIGSTSESGTVTNGLATYAQLRELDSTVTSILLNLTERIDNSLKDTTQTYYYGSSALVAAVNVTI